jgi:CRISPR-associated endonuclease Csy4
MNSYFDIKAIPDPELLQSTVVGELMQALHKLLPKYEGRIGVGFPGYGQSRTLGGIIRMHGSEQDLRKLECEARDNSTVNSYALITPAEEIPGFIKGYAIYQRLHVKGASHYRRLEKRHKARGTWTEQLEQDIAENYRQATICPHAGLRSLSTGQCFLLFVQQSKCKEQMSGMFNAYGLSIDGANVPLF